MPVGYSSGLKSLLSNLLQVDATRRPKASEILEYWIPLIFRNLGKNKGYSYTEDDVMTISRSNKNLNVLDVSSLHSEEASAEELQKSATLINELPTAQTETNNLMNAVTIAPNDVIQKR